MNFVADVVERFPAGRLALVSVSAAGERREISFGEVAEHAAALSGALAARGVRRGDVVMTLIGSTPDWVSAMLACWRLGAAALPCSEQLRAKDLRLRLDAAQPRAIVAHERNLGELGAAGPAGGTAVLTVPDESLYAAASPAPVADLGPEDPALVIFTSGTSGEPRGIVHGHRYLPGQRLQSRHWFGAQEGDLAWCTAASGWSKSARNVFVAPWLCGAAALLHDARFDPADRLDVLEREGVNALCMAPTEYRVIAKRATLRPIAALRSLVAAGEALNPEVLAAWHEATGLDVRDGYGQTETGQLTANPPGEPARPGSMGLALPGIGLRVDDGELVLDPASDPTFFVRYLDPAAPPPDRAAPWRTGDRVTQDPDGYLRFEGRDDDLIVSAGYRIGPFEVESALVSHRAVAEAAVVAAPDEERGSVVRAVVVLRDGYTAGDALAAELQAHVREQTAPYKYPRIVEFADDLPKTASGKVRRAALRGQG